MAKEKFERTKPLGNLPAPSEWALIYAD
ncbi:hypothetical protein I634_17605 [Alteromonas mediterranea U8]|nr:hypothetical protein I634_17605 [Alteromonas mediterranea U8]